MRKVLTSAHRHWRLRSATALAAVGAMVMTSGAVLLLGTTPATATQGDAHKVFVCHATSADSNPYVVISVDVASVKYQGHLEHSTNPNKTWQADGTWNNAPHVSGSAKPDLIEGIDFEGYPQFCESDGNTQPETIQRPVVDTAASCELGNGVRHGTTYVDLEWSDDANEWVEEDLSEQVTIWGDWVYTPYSAEDYARLCEKTPPPPPPPAELQEVVPLVTFTDADCDSLGGEDWDGTLEAFLDYEATGEVGPGETVVVEAMIEPAYADEYEVAEGAETEFTHTFADITLEDCVQGEETVIPKPDKPEPKPVKEPTVKGVEVVAPPAAAPTAVAAGLAGDSGTAAAQLLGQVLAGLGMAMLIAAGALAPRRVRGVHEN